MTELKLIRGKWIITGPDESDPVLNDGAVAVADGTIGEVGSWAALRPRYPDAEVLGAPEAAVIPGLINAHHHSHGVSGIQHNVPDLLLESWLVALMKQRAGDPYLETLLSNARLLRTGVTTVLEAKSTNGTAAQVHDDLRACLKAYDEGGLRVAFAAGVADQSHLVHGKGADEAFLAGLPDSLRPRVDALLPGPDGIDADDYFAVLAELRAVTEESARIEVCFGPPGPQWVSDPVLERIAETAAAWDCNIQTHLNESLYEKLHGPRYYGGSNVGHLRDLGLLSPRLSLAHGVWLNDADIALLAESGTAVAHNPSSNLRLRAGIAPLNALIAAGVTLGLGMDGTTLDDDEDYFTEMRLALRLHRTPRLDGPAPTLNQIFALATTGGARLLRREGQIGRLSPGHAADLVILKTERMTWPWIAPESDPRALVLLRARADDVDSVLVAGEVVLRDGAPTRFDADAAGRELADRLAAEAYPDEAAALADALLPHIEAHYGAWDVPLFTPYSIYNSSDRKP